MLCSDFVSYQRTQTIPALDQSDQSCYDDGYVWDSTECCSYYFENLKENL